MGTAELRPVLGLACGKRGKHQEEEHNKNGALHVRCLVGGWTVQESIYAIAGMWQCL
jgi:hypothetical protein